MENSLPSPLDYIHIEMYLHQIAEMALSETVTKVSEDFPARLQREIAQSTQGWIALFLMKQDDLRLTPSSQDAEKHTQLVQYGRKIYGILSFSLSQQDPALRQQELEGTRLMAKTCAEILHHFELSFMMFNLSPLPDQLTLATLTRRQLQVLRLLCQGCDLAEIARQLHIGQATAEKHRQLVYAKLGAKNSLDVPLIAYRTGLFSPLADTQSDSN